MIEGESFEPYVILERPAPDWSPTHTPRRWTVLRGHKPAILLVDEAAPDGSGLDALLAAEGFGVYRTSSRESALELLRTHPAALMALVRLDLPGLDAPALIRELQERHRGLWIGMRADPHDHERAAAGYAAGAVDLFHLSPDPTETVVRLIRSVPWAVRLRDAAEQERMRREREGTSRRKGLLRRLSARLGFGVTLASAVLIGILAALFTRSWQESQDRWSAKLDRLIAAIEESRSTGGPADRQFDRWQRLEQLQLQRDAQRAFLTSQDEQRREDQRRDLFRDAPRPSYR